MSKELLFVGGPADGQRHVIADGTDKAFVDGAQYERKKMISRTAKFECFTHGPMRSFEVLDKLFEGYRRAAIL